MVILNGQDHIPCSFTYKVVCVDDNFSKPIVLYRGENAVYKFLVAILKEYNLKIMKKYFNKNLIMSEEDEKHFNQVINVGYVINYLQMKIKK